MTFLNDISGAVVPLVLALAVFFWKAHRWRHPARGFWSACLMLVAVVAFVALLTAFVLQQLAAYDSSREELAVVMLALTVGVWIAARLILRAELKPFRRDASESSDSITTPTLLAAACGQIETLPLSLSIRRSQALCLSCPLGSPLWAHLDR